MAFVVLQFVEILPEGGQVKGGIRGQGQHAAAHVHHRRRHALDGLQLPVLPHLPLLAGGVFGQQVLRGGLEGEVQGEHHVVSRLRYLAPLLADHVAVLVLDNAPGAVDAVEGLLKGQLHPILAHGGVHGVAQFLIAFRLLAGDDGPGVAQHVGGVAGLVFPGGGRLNAHAGQAVLRHLGDKNDVYPPGKDVGVVVDAVAAQVQLVQHPGQLPVPLGECVPVLHQAEGFAHGEQELFGGGFGQNAVRVQPFILLHPGQPAQAGVLSLLLPVLVFHLGGKGGGDGVGPGGGFGDGQVFRPLHPLLPADGQQAVQGGVAVLHDGGVQLYIVAHLVGDQHPAVAVQDVAAVAVHPLRLGDEDIGIGKVAGTVHNLHLVEHGAEAGQHGAEQQDEQVGAQLETVGLPLRLFLLDVGVVEGVIHGRSSRS